MTKPARVQPVGSPPTAAEPPPSGTAPTVDPDSATRMLLAMSHLQPSDSEIQELADAFAGVRAGVRSLYAVTEARYALPAQVFSAACDDEYGDLG